MNEHGAKSADAGQVENKAFWGRAPLCSQKAAGPTRARERTPLIFMRVHRICCLCKPATTATAFHPLARSHSIYFYDRQSASTSHSASVIFCLSRVFTLKLRVKLKNLPRERGERRASPARRPGEH